MSANNWLTTKEGGEINLENTRLENASRLRQKICTKIPLPVNMVQNGFFKGLDHVPAIINQYTIRVSIQR